MQKVFKEIILSQRGQTIVHSFHNVPSSSSLICGCCWFAGPVASIYISTLELRKTERLK